MKNSPKTEKVNVSVWQKHVDKHIRNLQKKRAQTVKIFLIIQYCSGFRVNRANGLSAMMYMLVILLLIIIVISSVSLIYNAFAISLTERTTSLGCSPCAGNETADAHPFIMKDFLWDYQYSPRYCLRYRWSWWLMPFHRYLSLHSASGISRCVVVSWPSVIAAAGVGCHYDFYIHLSPHGGHG